MRLHLEIDVESMKKFMTEQIKKIVKFNPEFTLVVKMIFSREKTQQQSRSFVRKTEARLKAIHVEVVRSQALEVTLAVRKVIKSLEFSKIYNIKVYFSL